MMGCVQCLRVVLVIFNFLVVLVGLGILGFSVYVSQEPEAQDIIRASGLYLTMQIILYALMVIGGVTLITALFGCCGAYHESQCLLGIYFAILLIIFTTQVTGATLGYVFREEIMKYADEQMMIGVQEYPTLRDQRENPSPFMDSIQRLLECCGVTSYKDYVTNIIPLACCDRRLSNCDSLHLRPEEVFTEASSDEVKTETDAIKLIHYNAGSDWKFIEFDDNDGCRDKYKRVFKEKLIILFLVAISIAAFEVFCLLFSMVMCCAIRQYHSDYYGVDYAINT